MRHIEKTHSLDRQDSKAFTNPVFEPILADPTVIQDPESKLFYAYGTEDNWDDGHGARTVPILESEDLVHWEYVGDAFGRETRPQWKGKGGIWAPDIQLIKGTYFLYYAFSVWADPNPGIGVATSENPRGPFKDQGKIFDSESINVPNSIDPFLYTEGGNDYYLFWGSYSDLPTQGTYAVQLDEGGKKVREGAKKVKIAAGDFEAVMIHKHEGYFYFFGSKGGCCDGANSTYHVNIARSKNLLGPYLDKNGDSILHRGTGSALLTGSDHFKGPGHVSNIITDSKNRDWILYHAIDESHGKLSNGTTRRILMLDQIKWKDGWPYIENGMPSSEPSQAPTF